MWYVGIRKVHSLAAFELQVCGAQAGMSKPEAGELRQTQSTPRASGLCICLAGELL